MDSPYSIPSGVYAIPDHLIDTRADAEVDHDILNPKPVSDEKNIWFFWNTGYTTMHPYAKRNVRAWHRRLSRKGWTIRVVDRVPSSPLNVNQFLNVNDPNLFPRAFQDDTLTGTYAAQHTSDLVRWPLLLAYGGVYADVGMIQIGDLDRLWNETVANPDSPYEVLSYNMGGPEVCHLTNYFLASGKNNRLFERSHRLLLALWAEDGGKQSTDGMHASPLLKEIPLIPIDTSFEEDGRVYGPKDVSVLLTDYIIQGQSLTMVVGLLDEEDDWNGPKYVAEHVYAIDYMEGSQLINELTAWDGPKQFRLMSLPLPKDGEAESDEQKEARKIVENCLSRSFGFKLAHGLILRVMGDTLGSLWRKHEGSDNIPGTYAHWLRHGTMYWNQEAVPPTLKFAEAEPVKRGRLLQ